MESKYDISKVRLDEIVESPQTGIVSMYFTVPKDWVTDRYPDAAGAELMIEFPVDNLSSDHYTVALSPTDKDGSDFDWDQISLSPKDELELLCTGFLQRKTVPNIVSDHPDREYIPPHSFKTLFQLLRLQDELGLQRAESQKGGNVFPVNHLVFRCLEEAMTQTILTNEQSNALLNLPDPFNSITQEIMRRDNVHRDYLPTFLCEYADQLIRERSIKQNTPVCYMTWKQALETDRIEEYRFSCSLNEQCAASISSAINQNYKNYHLDVAAAYKEVAQQFCNDRILYVLAATLQRCEHDKRYSQENIAWAKKKPVIGWTCPIISDTHSGLLNMFAIHAYEKSMEKAFPMTISSQIEAMENRQQLEYRELAMDLDLFSWAFYYNDYLDQVPSASENIKCIMRDLEQGNTLPYLQFLQQTKKERAEPHVQSVVDSLTKRLEDVPRSPLIGKDMAKEF